MEKEKYCVEKSEPWKELPVFSLFSTKGAGEETIEKPDGREISTVLMPYVYLY